MQRNKFLLIYFNSVSYIDEYLMNLVRTYPAIKFDQLYLIHDLDVMTYAW